MMEKNRSNHLTQKHILLCHHAIPDHSSFVRPQSVTTQSCCSHTPHVVVVTCMCVISTRHVLQEALGSVYCLTSDKRLIHLDSGFRFPNGITVIHDGELRPSKLLVAETPTRLLWSYDITGPGVVTNKSIWGKLPGKVTEGCLCTIFCGSLELHQCVCVG